MVQFTIMLVMSLPNQVQKAILLPPPADGLTRHPDMNGTEIKPRLGPSGRWYLRGLRRSTRGDATSYGNRTEICAQHDALYCNVK
jgi:hypothetical protein